MKTIEKKRKMNVEAGMKPKDPLPSRCDWERGPTCLSKTGRSRSAPLSLSLSLFSGSGAASPRFPREREREAGGRGDGRLRAGDDGAQDARHPHPREEGRPRQDQGTNPPSLFFSSLAHLSADLTHYLRISISGPPELLLFTVYCFLSPSTSMRRTCSALVEGIFSSWQSLLLYLGFNLLNKKGSHACPTFVCIVN